MDRGPRGLKGGGNVRLVGFTCVAIVGFLGAVVFYPMLNSQSYQDRQVKNREAFRELEERKRAYKERTSTR